MSKNSTILSNNERINYLKKIKTDKRQHVVNVTSLHILPSLPHWWYYWLYIKAIKQG